jgi:hypothetical protein
MACRILYDIDNDRACLYDSVTETAFGRVFHGDGLAQDKLEAFLKWYAKWGAHSDPRLDFYIGDTQDRWLASLDNGCDVCLAEPWETCEPDEEHERSSVR